MRNMFTPRGRLIAEPRQSDASIRRILDADPQVQTLRTDSKSYNDWSQTISRSAIVSRKVSKGGQTVLRRKSVKRKYIPRADCGDTHCCICGVGD